MEQHRIPSLLAEASASYNAGDYTNALGLWREVERLDPGNTQAQEGIRMASLLLGSRDVAANPRVEAGIARVRELINAGLIDEAREGCALLQGLAPEHPGLESLIALCGPTAAPAGAANVESLLEEARESLAAGREDDAARAAARALELEPGNMEACGILSLTSSAPLVGEPPAPADDPAPESDDHDTQRQPALRPPPPEPAGDHTSSDNSTRRIAALLAEGQVAFDQGRLQDAISTWSRIFVIDHAHAEASRRIDMAKAAIEEQAREVDELHYRAMDAQEAGRLEEALGIYRQVLEVQPGHVDALKSVEEITARLADGGPAIPLHREPAPAPAAPEHRRPEPAPEDAESVPLAFEPAGRTEPTSPARPRPMPPPPAPARASGRVIALTGGILVFAVAGVGAWLWVGSDSGSMPEAQAVQGVPRRTPPRAPEAAPSPAPPAATATAPIQVLPGSAQPAAGAAPPVQTEAPDAGSPAEAREKLAQARQFHRERRWADAVLAYREAMRLDPVEFDAQDRLDEAMVELEKQARLEKDMETGMRLFSEADYGGALHTFYRLQLDRPEMKQIDTYIRNAWFNWGVLLLQAGDVDQAAEKFKEVLEINPSDPVSAKAREVALRYHGRLKDTALTSYASTLVPREIDAR